MSLITEYSGWFFFLCILLGASYALLLYYKNKSIEYSKKSLITMASLRGIAVMLIAFLLLGPMLKMVLKQKEKPIIIVAVDNSKSLVSGKDSLFYYNEFPKQLKQLIKDLKKDHELKLYSIGEKVVLHSTNEELPLDFNDKRTNLSDIFDHIVENYSNQNVGGAVLFTDGIFNMGSNPFYKTNQIKFPVYTVGLGDTEQQKDLAIASIKLNRKAYKGNYFPVEVLVNASKLAGNKATFTVQDENENILFQKEITISGNSYFDVIQFSLLAKENGIFHYKAFLTELDDEITHKNNHAIFYVEVIDSKEKIAILYNSPHPDISAIKQALETSDNYEIELWAAETFKGNPEIYSLIIFHQLPSQNYPMSSLFNQIQQSKTSTLFILGSQTNLLAFNKLNSGLVISTNKQLFNDAFPLYNDNFSIFSFSEESKELFSYAPPLHTFFGEYKLSVSAHVFLYQKINNVVTDYPLILFNQMDGMKTGVIAGDGIWQWNIYNYVNYRNHDAFNELINKIVLYLSVKDKGRFFKVFAKNVYDESENLFFKAELYNESYELISDPDVKMTLTDDEGKQYTALFSKKYNAYELNMGSFPPGKYHWEATTSFGSKKYSDANSCLVIENDIETHNLVADHTLLQTISQHTDGKFYEINELEELIKDIQNDENIKTISSFSKNYNLLLNSWLYFVVLVLLFGVEWFLRKWGGGY